ncbi:MAG TPA: tetratricopeptide repeat protein [Streptosporangiaceae bacterium]|nr:tetratricopeptide repeat protein [Streptosporangiaceae bacterium]
MKELLSRVETHDPAGSVAAVYVIDGMPGVGKTAFVIHAAHCLAGRYPGGAIFVDLLGFTGSAPLSVSQALEELLAQAGVPRVQVPGEDGPKQALWRRLMRSRRVLIVLDNARDAKQVEPLLPQSPQCLVLITARTKLYELDADPVSLPVLTDQEARRLFVAVAGAQHCRDDEALEHIVAGCHRLPLAIRLMAGRVRHGDPIAEVADDIAALPEETKIRGVFDLSYNSLDADLQRAVRLLGVYPGIDITGPAMASLAGTSQAGGRRLLRGLAIHNLIERIDKPTGHSGEHGSQSRYQPHDLLRDYARSRADVGEPAAERQAALDRLTAHYRAVIHAVEQQHAHPEGSRPRSVGLVFQDLAHANAWLITERANLLACLGTSPAGPADLAKTTADLLNQLSYFRDAGHCYQLALTHHRKTANRQGEAHALGGLAEVDWLRGHYEASRHRYEQARAICQEIGDRQGEANALGGLAEVDRLCGRYEASRHRYEQARAICHELGDRQGEAYALGGLGEMDRLRGRYEAAHHRFEQYHAICQGIGNRRGEADALCLLAEVDWVCGRYEASRHRYEQGRAIFQEIGNRHGEAFVMGAGRSRPDVRPV